MPRSTPRKRPRINSEDAFTRVQTPDGERYFVSRRQWSSNASTLTRFNARGQQLGRYHAQTGEFVPMAPLRRERLLGPRQAIKAKAA